MDINEMKIKDVREVRDLFMPKPATIPNPFWKIGEKFFLRTVTHIVTGRLVYVDKHELVLEDAAWVADTGRYGQALVSGELGEVEPYPTGQVAIGRGALIDGCRWHHDLPREVK